MTIKEYYQSLLKRKDELKKLGDGKTGFDLYPISQQLETIDDRIRALAVSCIKANPIDGVIEKNFSNEEKCKLVDIAYRRAAQALFHNGSPQRKTLNDNYETITADNYKDKLNFFDNVVKETAKNAPNNFVYKPSEIEGTLAYLYFNNSKNDFFDKFIDEFDKIDPNIQDQIIEEVKEVNNPLLEDYKKHMVQPYEKEIDVMKFFAKNKAEKEALDFVKENVKTFDRKYQSEFSSYSFKKVNDVELEPRKAIKKLKQYPQFDKMFENRVDPVSLTMEEGVLAEQYRETYQKEIKNLKFDLSDQAKDAMKKVMHKMDDINLVNDINMYQPEEGEKSYAFIKLDGTIKSIQSDIKKGNTKGLVEHVNQYKKNYADMQELLDIAKENFLQDGRSYSGNLDIARNDELPPEFKVQEQTTSQLSTMLISLKACRLINVPIEEYVDDPAGFYTKAEDKILDMLGYNEANFTDDMSENIHKMLSPKVASAGDLGGILMRALDGIAFTEKDPNKYAYNSYVRALMNNKINSLSAYCYKIDTSMANNVVDNIANMLVYEGKPNGYLQFIKDVKYDQVKKEDVEPFNREEYAKNHEYDYAKTAQRLQKEVDKFLSFSDISDAQKQDFVKGASKAIEVILEASLNKNIDPKIAALSDDMDQAILGSNKDIQNAAKNVAKSVKVSEVIENQSPDLKKLIEIKKILDTKELKDLPIALISLKETSKDKSLSDEFVRLTNIKNLNNKQQENVTGFNKIQYMRSKDEASIKIMAIADATMRCFTKSQMDSIAKQNLTQKQLYDAAKLTIEGICGAYKPELTYDKRPNSSKIINELDGDLGKALKTVDDLLVRYHKDLKVEGIITSPIEPIKESIFYGFACRNRKQSVELLEQYVSDTEKKKILEDVKKEKNLLNDDIMSHTTQDLQNEIDTLKSDDKLNKDEKEALEYVENNIKITSKDYQSAFEDEGFYKVTYAEVKPKEIMRETKNDELLSGVYGKSNTGTPIYDPSNKDAVEKVSKVKFKFSQDTISAIKQISKKIDDMHIINDDNVRTAEEGTKCYGFVTLHNSIAKIRDAIKEGNTKDLPKLVENYKTTYADSMELLSIAKNNFRKDGISYGANVDVVRNKILPSEIKKEEQATSQISTILIAKKFCIVNNIDFDQFIEDPSTFIEQKAKKYQKENGFKNLIDENSVGKSLYTLTHRPNNIEISQEIGLLMRGYDGLFGIEKDESMYNNNIFARSIMTAQYEMAAAAANGVQNVMEKMFLKDTFKNMIIYDDKITDYTELTANPLVDYSYETDKKITPFDRNKYLEEHEFDDKKTADRIKSILDDYCKNANKDEIKEMRDIVKDSIQTIIGAKSKDGKEFPELESLSASIDAMKLNDQLADIDGSLKTLKDHTKGEFDLDELQQSVALNRDLNALNISFVKGILDKAQNNSELNGDDLSNIVYSCQAVFNYATSEREPKGFKVDERFTRRLIESYFDKEIVNSNIGFFLDNQFESLDTLMYVKDLSKNVNDFQKAVGESDIFLYGILADTRNAQSKGDLVNVAQKYAAEYISKNINENIDNLNKTNVKEIYAKFKDCFSSIVDMASFNNPKIGTFKDKIFDDLDLNKIVIDNTPSRFKIEQDNLETKLETSSKRGYDRIQFAKERIDEIFNINKSNPRNAMVDSVAVLKVLEEKYATRTSTWKFFHSSQDKAETNALEDISNMIKDHFDITDAEIDGIKMMDKDSILFNESIREKEEPKINQPKSQEELIEQLGKEEAHKEDKVEKNKGPEEKAKSKEQVIE